MIISGQLFSIPGYDLSRMIHRGAQGVVYEAIQRATRRKVAIKVISDGPLASPKARARFQREVQLLAQIRHRNIVTIYDSGIEAGAFFYVMDFIAGHKLDVYLERRRPRTRESLELFAKIAEAVHAAHLHGVIHRDLKPGNVMIDDAGEPHVVDLGLAKAMIEEIPISHAVSDTGEFLGSMPWASPEQAEGDPARIDMRTDVYALGVMLYQMLTGRFPYPVVGKIRDVLDNIVHRKAIPPRSIQPSVDSDLETIVLKALNKDAERRYQSAGELARDIRHFLANEPITAKRDSTYYVLRKKLSRHRGAVAAALAFAVLLSGFAVTISFIRRDAHAAERRAVDIQLVFMERALAAVDPGNPVESNLEDLQAIALRVESELAAYPAVQARLMERIGGVFRRLGLFDAAQPYLQRALEIRRVGFDRPSAELASSLHSLAALRWDQGEYAAAERLYREALEIRRAVFGETHLLVADTINDLAGCRSFLGDFVEAEDLYRRSLSLRARIQDGVGPEAAATRNNLATCLMETGKYAEAEDIYRRTLTEMATFQDGDGLHGRERPQYVARAQTSLAACLVELGKFSEAEPLLRESLRTKRELLSPEHPSVAISLHWLAKSALDQGQSSAAETLAREALAIRISKLGERHPYTAISLGMLGSALLSQGRLDDAQMMLSDALDIQREKLPAGHWRTAYTGARMAECLTGSECSTRRTPSSRKA